MGEWGDREKMSWEKLQIILNRLYQVRSIRKIDDSDFKKENQGMRMILTTIIEFLSIIEESPLFSKVKI